MAAPARLQANVKDPAAAVAELFGGGGEAAAVLPGAAAVLAGATAGATIPAPGNLEPSQKLSLLPRICGDSHSRGRILPCFRGNYKTCDLL